MLGFFAIGHARRAAVDTVKPWVDVTRESLGPIPEEFWRSPYIKGFLASLISTAATSGSPGRLGGNQLGLVQLDAWVEITGQSPDEIGQDITFLSSSRDPQFQEGVRNAARFFNVIEGGELSSEDIAALFGRDGIPELPQAELREETAVVFGAAGMVGAALWRRLFEHELL